MLESTILNSVSGLKEYTFGRDDKAYTVWASSERDARDLADDLEEQDRLALADRYYSERLGF